MISAKSRSMAPRSKRSWMRREKYPTCRKYIRRSRPTWPLPARMAISISAPPPRRSSSLRSSRSSPSSATSRSTRSCTRGSSGPRALRSPSPRAWRSRKYRLKMRSNVSRSRPSLTSVEARAVLNVSRSSRPTSAVAARASSASDGEMRISARRRSPMNSRMRWSIRRAVAMPSESLPRATFGRSLREDLVQRAAHALEVLFVLHEHGQRRLNELGVQRLRVEDDERARPVERLRDRWRLAEVEPADLLNGGHDLARELRRDFRHLEPDDLQLLGRSGKVDEEMQAAALEAVGELPRIVRRQHHERQMPGADRSELGHRDLEVGEHFEQERFELGLGLVDLVHQQDHRRVGLDGL